MSNNDRLAMELGSTHHVVFLDTNFPSVYVNGNEAALKAIKELNPNGKNEIRDLVAIDRLTKKIRAI